MRFAKVLSLLKKNMSKWNDIELWSGLVDGSTCPICVRGYALDSIHELEISSLTMFEQATMRGYICLVSRIHVVELHELTDEQASAFMRDICKVSKAVTMATGAVKMNYEIHGNTLPHLHIHFFPRYRGDQFEGCVIEPKKVVQPVYEAGEFERLREKILKLLDGNVTK
jgi:diadenosine tetraphosphate (Ap4A) HIT family hydrolase